jgi:hypothetical protein
MSSSRRGPRRRSKGGASSLVEARQRIASNLWARQAEIEEEIWTRIDAIPDAAKIVDPEYDEGRLAAVSAAVDYGITVIAHGDAIPPPVPAVLLTQARLAARNGVSFETVARRYAAGYTRLAELLVGEIESAGLYREAGVKSLLQTQGMLLDGLIAAAGAAYEQERARPGTEEVRRAELVRRLLAGEALDTFQLRYDFSAFHIGALARGPGATNAIKGLAKALCCVALVVSNGDGAIWAWLGRRDRHDVDQLSHLVSSRWPSQTSLAIGEPGRGIIGWRRTHQQASAAFIVAMHKPGSLIRYADSEFLCLAMRDRLLSASLRENYLLPLAKERDGGAVLRKTLRAYFAAGRNGASAAVALKVTRQTVKSRLEATERRIGRPVRTCGAELETALRLDEITRGQPGPI